jgi:putative FmdB family regulatory protein
MPIYDYQCRECGHAFADFASINDPLPSQCPECQNVGCVCRLISGTFGNVEMHSREYFKNVIEPEAKKIAERIKHGDENALADIIGEEKMRQR